MPTHKFIPLEDSNLPEQQSKQNTFIPYNDNQLEQQPFFSTDEQTQDVIRQEETGWNDNMLNTVDRLENAADWEKDWLKSTRASIGREMPNGEVFTEEKWQQAKAVLNREDPNFTSGILSHSQYYWDQKSGMPVALKSGEKPPVNAEIQSAWGGQQEADDDLGITTLAKGIYNGFIGIGSLPTDIAATVQGLVIGQEKDPSYKTATDNAVDRLKFATSSKSKEGIVDAKAFESFAQFISSDNWSPNSQNTLNLIGQGLGSLAQFMVGGKVVQGATDVAKAGKAAAAGEGATAGLTKWLATNKAALTSGSMISLHEGLNAADAVGLKGREKYAFAVTTAIGMGALEMIGGFESRLLGIGEKQAITKAVAKEFVDTGADITATSLKRVFDSALQTGGNIMAQIGKQFAGEAVEEASQTYFTAAMQDIYRTLDGTDNFQSALKSTDTAKEAFEGALVGAAIGGGMSSVSGQAKEDAQASNVYKMLKMGKKEELFQGLQNLAAAGDLSPVQLEQAKDKITMYEGYLANLKNEGLNEHEEEAAMKVLNAADNLEASIEEAKKTNLPEVQKTAKVDVLIDGRKKYINELKDIYSGEWFAAKQKQLEKEAEASEVAETPATTTTTAKADTQTTGTENKQSVPEVKSTAKETMVGSQSMETERPKKVSVSPTKKLSSAYEKPMIAYATPGTGKSKLVKELGDNAVDGDALLVEAVKEIKAKDGSVAFPDVTEDNVGATINDVFAAFGDNVGKKIYSTAMDKAVALKEQGKTVLFGSTRLINDPRIDRVFVSRDASKVEAKMGSTSAKNRLDKQEKELTAYSAKGVPIELGDKYISDIIAEDVKPLASQKQPQKEIDAEADIERRRQEELDILLKQDTERFWNTAFEHTLEEFKQLVKEKFNNSDAANNQAESRWKVSNQIIKKQFDKINAKYDAELAALETVKPQKEIEAKKADIERRRQEELQKIATDRFPNTQSKLGYHGSPNYFENFDKSKLGTYTGAASAKEGIFFGSSKDVSKSYLDKRGQTLNVSDYIKTKFGKEISDKINKGYNYIASGLAEKVLGYKPERITENEDIYGIKLKDGTILYDDGTIKGNNKDAIFLSNFIKRQDALKSTYDYNYGGYIDKDRSITDKPFEDLFIRPFILNTKNPFITSDEGKEYREETYFERIKKAKEQNSDGVIINDTFDSKFQTKPESVYVIFEPEQIHILTQEELNKVDKINAKYDAELAALETVKPQPTEEVAATTQPQTPVQNVKEQKEGSEASSESSGSEVEQEKEVEQTGAEEAPATQPSERAQPKSKFTANTKSNRLTEEEKKKYAISDKITNVADAIAKAAKVIEDKTKGQAGGFILPPQVLTGAMRIVEQTLRATSNLTKAIEDALEWIADSKNYPMWEKLSPRSKAEAAAELKKNIDKAIEEFNAKIDTIKSDATLTDKEKDEKLLNLFSENAEEMGKQFFGDRDDYVNSAKAKIRKNYEDIEGFKTLEEIENKLVEVAKQYPTWDKQISGFIETLKASDDAQIKAIGEKFTKLKDGEVISTMNFFQSLRHRAYLSMQFAGNQKQFRVSNSTAEKQIVANVKKHMESITPQKYQEAYNKMVRTKDRATTIKYLTWLTGLDETYWKAFEQYYKKKGKLQDDTLRMFVAKGNKPAFTTKELFQKALFESSFKEGSSLSKIVLNLPLMEQTKYLKSRFNNVGFKKKNTWSLMSDLDKRVEAINTPEFQKSKFYKDNEFVHWEGNKDGAEIYAMDGVFNNTLQKNAPIGEASPTDLKFLIAELYKNNGLTGNDGEYLQSIGQFGDKDHIQLVRVKKYKNFAEAKAKLLLILKKQGIEAKPFMEKLNEEVSEWASQVAAGENQLADTRLFLMNYAINDFYLNEFFNGDLSKYIKNGDLGTQLVNIYKRNGSMISPGIRLATNINGGVGESHNLVILQGLKEDVINEYLGKLGKEKIKIGDGASFVTRAFSDKIKKSAGTNYNFNTLIKAITSYVTPEGQRMLDKTHSVTIDELAEQFPDSQFPAILEFMKANEIDKITTDEGAKLFDKSKLHDLFGKKKFDKQSIIKVDNNNLLVQQDLLREAKFTEGNTPIQVLKNEMIGKFADEIAVQYSDIAKERINTYIEKLFSMNDEDLRTFLKKEMGFERDQDVAEADGNQDEILRLIDAGVSLKHQQIASWLVKYISNQFSSNALGRLSNKGIYVEAPNYNIGLKGTRVVNGKVLLPEVAISGEDLRGPKEFTSIEEATKYASTLEDMTDENGELKDWEIEKIGDKYVVPGELLKITRVPADAMHSTFLGRVKHVVSKESGNVLFSPSEQQYASGNDFDGDARIVERLFKSGSKGSKAIANAAFKKSWHDYYQPENVKHQLKGIDLEAFDEYLPKESTSYSIGSPKDFLGMRQLYQVGLKVVGQMANMQSIYSFLKKLDISLNKGFEYNGKTVYTFNKDIDTASIIGNFLNLALDNAKEVKIERLGLNEVTANSFTTMLMLGYSPKEVIELFTSPEVKKYVEKVRSANSVLSNVDSFNAIKDIAETIAKGSTGQGGAFWSAQSKGSPLYKLQVLSRANTLAMELNSPGKFIKATEKAANTFADHCLQINAGRAIQTLDNGSITTGVDKDLKWINIAGFTYASEEGRKVSAHLQPAIDQINAMNRVFKTWSIASSATSISLLRMLENKKAMLNKSKHERAALNSEEIEQFEKAITAIFLVDSFNITESTTAMATDIAKEIATVKANPNHPYYPFYNSLEVADGIIKLREDMRVGELSEEDRLAIQDNFEQMYFEGNNVQKKSAQRILNYVIAQYQLNPSKYTGSYATLMGVEIQRAIGVKAEEHWKAWENVVKTEQLLGELLKNNPELEFAAKDKVVKKVKNPIYEPNVQRKSDITMNTEKGFNYAKNNDGVIFNVGQTGVESWAKLIGGDEVTIKFGDKVITKTIEDNKQVVLKGATQQVLNEIAVRTGYEIKELEALKKNEKTLHYITFKKGEESNKPQQQKKSEGVAITSPQRQKLIDRLKKALPAINVIDDATIGGAGQLDANGKTVRLNPKYNNADTPIHEFAHALIDIMGGTANGYLRKGIDQLKTTELWKEIQKRYSDLSVDMQEKELLAEAIGREGAVIFVKREQQSWFKNWLDVLFNKIKGLLGLERNIAKRLAMELLSGTKQSDTTAAVGQEQMQYADRDQAIADMIKRSQKNIEFDEAKHVYKIGGKVYQSVTTLKNKLADYAYTGTKSGEFDINSKLGTNMHKTLEGIVKGTPKSQLKKKALEGDEAWTKDEKVFDDLYTQLNDLVNQLKKTGIVMAEVRLANEANQVAGTADLLHIQRDGSVSIYDLKSMIHTVNSPKYTSSQKPGKKSKKDSHGAQLAAYANMLEMGDKLTKLPEMSIDTLHVIPVKIEIDGDMVISAQQESLTSFGYTKYKPEAKRILTNQPDATGKNKYEDEIRQMNNGLVFNDVNQYADARKLGLARLKEQRDQLNTQDTTALSEAEKEKRKENLKRLTDNINDIEKAFEVYKRDLKDLSKLWNDYKDDIETADMDTLMMLYSQIKRYDDIARKEFLNRVLVRIAVEMRKFQEKIDQQADPEYKEEMYRNEDLTAMNVHLKALSDMGEEHPEFQYLSTKINNRLFTMNKRREQLHRDAMPLAEAVIKEYNKKAGITEKTGQLFNPIADNSKYFSYMEDPDKKGEFRDPKDPKLTDAQRALLEHVIKNRNQRWVKESHRLGGNDLDDMQIIKVDPSGGEVLKQKGLFTAWAQYLSNGRDINNVVVKFTNPKSGVTGYRTFGQIKTDLAQLANDGLWTKIRMMAELKKYQVRARVQLDKGINADGTQIYDGSQGDSRITMQGEVVSRHSNYFNKDRFYTRDFFKAYLTYMNDMIFVSEMNGGIDANDTVDQNNSIMPYIDAIEAFARDTNKPNKLAYIEILKKGKILRESIVGKTGHAVDDTLRILRVWSFLKTMAFNYPAGVFNLIVGKYNQFVFDDGIGALSLKGERMMVKDYIKAGFKADKSKSLNIVNKYHAISYDPDMNPANHIGKFWSMLMFGAHKLTESWIQASSFLAQMSEEELSWHNDNGEIIGKDAEEVAKRTETMNKKAEEYIKRVSDVQGKYSAVERRNFAYYEIGKSVGQFKQWMPDAWNMRFKMKYINREGKEVSGSMASLFQVGLRDAWLDIHTPEFWTSNELKYRLARQNLKELCAFGMLAIASMGYDDDDEKNMQDYSYRVLQDASSMFRPGTYEYLLKNPSAGISTAAESINAMSKFLSFYKSNGKGHKKGDWMFPGQVFDQLPYNNLIEYPAELLDSE